MTEVPFQALFKEQTVRAGEPELLKKARARAWERFLELGLPKPKHDAYQYMNLRPLFAENFTPSQTAEIKKERILEAVLPESAHSYVVFVNGYFRKELSDTSGVPSSIVISTLTESMRPFGAFITNTWTKRLKEEVDLFAVLNLACYQDGLFIYIPPKVVVQAPIQLISIVDHTTELSWIMPRLQLFQGAHSEATYVTTLVCNSDKKYLYNQTTELTLEEGARAHLIQSAESTYPESIAPSWFFDDLRVELKRSAYFKAFQLSDGKSFLRRDSKIELAGEASEASLNGIWLLDGQKESHTHVVIEHQEPHTQSMQFFKGVLANSSRSSFQGKILVRKKAQKTEAYQLNNNLLLSDTAQANSKPNLEIFADDVKASHGATAGQLDPEELFYLKARGFPEQLAKACLIAGFCKEVVDELPIISLKEKVIERVQKYVTALS